MKRVALLLLACVAALATEPEAQESKAEPLSTADTNYFRPEVQRNRQEVHRNRHEDHRNRHEDLGNRYEELRNRHEEHEQHSHGHHGHNMRNHKEIIEDVYSPDYHEPTLVLDYRYLKSGGRDYVRGPGGQVLILPHGVRNPEHKEFQDFDALIEHLRHKSERAYQVEDVSRPNHIDQHRPWFNQVDEHQHLHGHHQQQWHL